MKQKYYLALNAQEHRLMIESLNKLRNKLIALCICVIEQTLVIFAPLYEIDADFKESDNGYTAYLYRYGTNSTQ